MKTKHKKFHRTTKTLWNFLLFDADKHLTINIETHRMFFFSFQIMLYIVDSVIFAFVHPKSEEFTVSTKKCFSVRIEYQCTHMARKRLVAIHLIEIRFQYILNQHILEFVYKESSLFICYRSCCLPTGFSVFSLFCMQRCNYNVFGHKKRTIRTYVYYILCKNVNNTPRVSATYSECT